MAQTNCPKCGSLIPDNSKFCLECGAQITKPDMHDYNNSDESVEELLAEINELLTKPSKSTKHSNATKNTENTKLR